MREPDPFSLSVAIARLAEALLRLALVVLLAPIVALAWIVGAIPAFRGVRTAACAVYGRIASPFD